MCGRAQRMSEQLLQQLSRERRRRMYDSYSNNNMNATTHMHEPFSSSKSLLYLSLFLSKFPPHLFS